MATERLLHEIRTGDVPKIDAGNFFWQPVNRVSTLHARAPSAEAKINQKPIAQQLLETPDLQPPPRLDEKSFPLDMLENRTFAGTGYNTIWRPRSKTPLPLDAPVPGGAQDVLELNLTAETLTFSKSLGDVPNRGVSAQKDLLLKGLSYVQRVGAFEDFKSGRPDSRNPVGIHFEPGVLMFVPLSNTQPATINRMASIPHGTTINAQGLVPSVNQIKGPPKFDSVSIIPFEAGAPDALDLENFKQHLDFKNNDSENRLPSLTEFKSMLTGTVIIITYLRFPENNTITENMFKDPNEVLRQAIADQKIESFVTFELTTDARKDAKPPVTFVGGGTSNIGFLQGAENPPKVTMALGNTGNSHAIKMTVRYWIETVAATLTIKPKSSDPSDPQEFRMVSAAGILGPTFFVPASATAKLDAPIQKKVTWTQIQYSQNVTLNFSTKGWPHISVATLGDTSRIPIEVPL
jgi:hypothetical protein